MEFKELELLWNSTGNTIEANAALNQKMIKEITYKKVKGKLLEITGTAYFELIVAIFWTIYLQNFIRDSFGEPRFLIPAIILLGITVFSSILAIRKLHAYYSISADKSISQTQKQLLNLRLLEKIDITSILVIIPLFSAPFFIVIAKAWFNMDLYIFSKQLAYYTIGSLLVAIVLFLIVRIHSFKKIDQAIKQLERFK